MSDPAGGDPAAGDGAAPRLVFLLAGFGDAAGAFRVDDGWVSFAYGAREAAPVARWTQAAGGDQEAVTFLVPVPPGRPAPRVRELPTVGGRAFEVAFGDASDPAPGAGVLVLLRGAADTAVEAAGVLTDADAALVWRDAGGAPRRVAFAGGRSLRAGADTIVRSGGTPGDRAAGDWHAADLTERLD